jgi:hypothetical protein
VPVITFIICYWGLEWSLPASLLIALLADMEPHAWRRIGRAANAFASEEDDHA